MAKIVLIISVVLVAGCIYPVAASDSCQAQINTCLQDCPIGEATADPMDGQGTGLDLTDHRSPCEKNCHTLCQ